MVDTPIVSVRDLVKTFAGRGTSFKKSKSQVQAVAGISFDVHQGETLSIVGESGCGKSTTARCVTRILKPTSGSIELFGTEVSHASQEEIRPLRRQFQMVFQDPYGSLSPRRSIVDIVAEPLEAFGMVRNQRDKRERVAELLTQVGLPASIMDRNPRQFSGGQRQRIGIARALYKQASVLVFDEATSALDSESEKWVQSALEELMKNRTSLIIAHRLSTIRSADKIIVMESGKIVEMGSHENLMAKKQGVYQKMVKLQTENL
mgnify:CR=1 FL=1